MEEKELVMKFDPNTIEHLGLKMYSRIPTAIAELIANSYDADAHLVKIILEDGKNKSITVVDNGEGMTFDEINEHFLKIGRNRRIEEGVRSLDKTRFVTGKKGLGKLALFGIGNAIEVNTVKDGQKVIFRMDWNKLKNTHDGDYKPEVVKEEKSKEKSGTIIKLTDLKRETDFDVESLAISLSKLFNFIDKNFKVVVINGKKEVNVNKELRYSELDKEYEFVFPEYSKKAKSDYKFKNKITGKILTTKTPLKPGLRGVTLFANGRLVNAPEFFGRSESSHFYSYVTGWLDVDFVDEWKDDVISTNRQSLDWDLEDTKALQEFLQKALSQIEWDWRDKRSKDRIDKIQVQTKVNIGDWYNKIPPDFKKKIEPLINTIIDDSELSEEKQTKVVQSIHTMIPEYPYYHWRHLHSKIQDTSKDDYENKEYYNAFLEAAKKYINTVKAKSKTSKTDARDIMSAVFGDNGNLKVACKYKKPDGTNFDDQTIDNVEEGQKFLSMGVVAGGRNPVSHEEKKDLRESGLFSEMDCLDELSILSHLFRRLDKAKKKNKKSAPKSS